MWGDSEWNNVKAAFFRNDADGNPSVVIYSEGAPNHDVDLSEIASPPKTDYEPCTGAANQDRTTNCCDYPGYSATNLKLPQVPEMEGYSAMDYPGCWVQSLTETITYTYVIPLNPTHDVESVVVDKNNWSPSGAMGMSITGIPMYPYLSNANTNVLTSGQADRCNGHAGRGYDYHYHGGPVTQVSSNDEDDDDDDSKVCIAEDVLNNQGHSMLFGITAEGYGIYGPASIGGSAPDDLDECGGHKHSTGDNYGYHYHIQDSAPHMIGCYRVKPVKQVNYSGKEWNYDNSKNGRTDKSSLLPCCNSQVMTPTGVEMITGTPVANPATYNGCRR
jgi:hypothetical protein